MCEMGRGVGMVLLKLEWFWLIPFEYSCIVSDIVFVCELDSFAYTTLISFFFVRGSGSSSGDRSN